MKIDWKTKLTSRKLWVALAGMLAGFVLAFGGSAETAETVSGCVLSVASVIGYLLAEGLVDANRTDTAAGEAMSAGMAIEDEPGDKLVKSLEIEPEETHILSHEDMGVM